MSRVPIRALTIAIASLLLPVLATNLVPEWLEGEGALLVWVPALLPAFVLAYYRGWSGASLALAAAMATLALTQVEVLLLGLAPPRWGTMFAVIALLVAVSLGAGWMADVLHGERQAAQSVALTDPLTGIPNRRHAGVFLDAGWGSAQRGTRLALVLFDLDRFKDVNDSHGHAEGDRVLEAFARILASRTRRMDLSARFGGEEFISILLDCSVEQASRFAEEVREDLAELDFGWGRVTASAGVAMAEEGMGSPDVLVAAADRALYAAKDRGRDQVARSDKSGASPANLRSVRVPAIPIREARVLVVDDDPDAARGTSRLIDRLGAKVSMSTAARDAVRRITGGEPFDVIVTDIVMPEMSGFTLIELATRAQPGIAALYMSGYTQEEVYWGGTPGARSAFVQKPIEIAELRRALENLLSGAGAQDFLDGSGPEVRAPAPTTSETLPLPSEDGASPDPHGQILILDDDPHVLRALVRIFERAGLARPIAISDPRQVRKMVERGDIDLLITDMQMPVMDGMQVLESIADVVEADEYFPVLMLTGNPDPELRRRALAAGAMDFLAKPFDAFEAEARVRNLLATRRLHRNVAAHRDMLEDLVRERTSALADSRTEILHRLARAAEYRDDITGRHAERVGLLGSLIAAELGMGARQVDLIRRTGPLHDVGKIGVPDAILRKAGQLTEAEFETMKTHTTIGAEILGGTRTDLLQCAGRIALSHHERFDGQGYPHGLAGQDIPIEARIVAVADVFDVLSHDRPYKRAVGLIETIEEIRASAGTHFDPDVVAAFVAIYERVGPDDFLALADPIDPSSDLTRSATGTRNR